MKEYQVNLSYDGIICIEANSTEEAKEIIENMNSKLAFEKSNGTWEVGAIEEKTSIE